MALKEFTGELDAPKLKEFTGVLDGEAAPGLNEVPPVVMGDAMGMGGADIMAAAQPAKPTSVLEGVHFDGPATPAGIDFKAASARSLAQGRKLPAARGVSEARPSPPVDQTFLDNAARVLRKTLGGINSGTAGIVQMVGDVSGLDSVSDFARTSGRAGKRFANKTEAGKTTIDGFTPNSPVQGLPGAIEDAAVSIGQQVPALATGNLPAALALMFGQSTGTQYGEVREKGLDIAPAIANSVLTGAAEVIGEKFGGTPGTMRALKGAVAGNAPARVAAEMARAGVRDIPGESLTTLLQYGTDAAPGIGTNAAPSFGELGGQLKSTVAQTMLQGGMMTGGGAALAGAAQKMGAAPKDGQLLPAVNSDFAAKEMAREIDAAAQEIADAPTPLFPQQTTMPHTAPAKLRPMRADEALDGEQPAPRTAQAQSAPQATETIAKDALEIPDQTTAATPMPDPVPAPATATQGVQRPGAAPALEADRTEPAAPTLSEPTNVQNQVAAGAPAQAQAAPAQTPAPAGSPGSGQAAAGPQAGTGPLQTAGVAPGAPASAEAAAPAQIGRNNVPMAEGGKPFKTNPAAKEARKLQPGMRVIKVDGGYALAEKTRAQLAAQEKAARRMGLPQTSARGEPIPAHAFIASAGGLAGATRSDMNMPGNVRIGNRSLFAGTGKGLTIERATEKLIEEGYLPEGAGHDQARELIKRSLKDPQYTPEGVERMAEKGNVARFEDHLAAQQEAAASDPDFDPFPDMGITESDFAGTGFAEATNETQLEVQALIAMADERGIDSETIMLDAHDATREGTTQDFYENAKSALETAIGQGRGDSRPDPGQQGNAPAEGQQQASPDRPDESLTSYTEGDVLKRLDALGKGEKETAAKGAKAEADAKKERERKDIASRQAASAENFQLGQDAEDALSGQQGMFSRPAAPAPEANALKALSENDNLFALARSNKDTVAGIVADTAPDITVQKSNDPAGRTVYTFTMPDGKKATMSVRPFNPYANEEAPTLYGYDQQEGELSGFVTKRPGNNPEDAGELDDVWVDVSALDTGGNGAKIYNIAETFAHNTGRIFIGDPAGLTDAALRRRTEQMLSSALKFGTTKHLAPHPRQVVGDSKLGVPALDWTYGDHVGNIEALIRTSLATYNDVNPLTFEPSTGRFLDSEGVELDGDAISQIVRIGRLGEAGAGRTTLQRNAILNALVRESGSEGGSGRPGAGLLERLVATALQHGASTRATFYSRTADDTDGSTSDGVRKALQERFGPLVARMEARGFLKIWDGTQDFNQTAKRSEQIEGKAQGLWDGNTAHLFADAIEPGSEIAVLLHEVGEHASMQKMLGPQKYTQLVDRARALVHADDATALEAVARIPDDTRPEFLDSELLAYMIETVAAKDAKASPSTRKWLADILAAIRAWWTTTGLSSKLQERYGLKLDLKPEDIAALAVRAVKWQGQQAGRQQTGAEPQQSRAKSKPPAGTSWTAPPGSPPVNPNTGGVLAPQPWTVSEPGAGDAFIRGIQNNKIDMKRVRDAIAQQFGTVPDALDPYLGEELYQGKVAARVTELHEKTVEPILKMIAVAGTNAGVTLDDVNQYLHARHAPERNAAMKAINPNMPNNDALSGMSDADAATVLAGFRSAGKDAALALIVKDIDQLNADTRTALVADGLEDAATVQAWEAAYKFYAPLQRDVKSSGTPKGMGFSVRGPEAKRAVGSNKDVVNILANIVAQAETAAIRAEKAKVGRALLEMAKAYPNPNFWKVDQAPTKPRLDPKTGLVIRGAVDPMYQTADNVLMVKDYGAEHFIVFNKDSERAMLTARAMKNLDAAPMNKILEVASKGTRFIASLLTQRNPLFWMTNFARDIQGALINLEGTDAEGLQAKVLGNLGKSFKGMHAIVRGNSTGQWARYAKEMQEAGGTTGYMQQFENSDARMKNLQREVDRMSQGKADPRKLGRMVLDFVDDYNDIIENAVRLSVFQAARQAGASTMKAASIAKNITVNFNRKGNLTPPVNALYMFFNASVQGTARLTQALVTSPKAQALVGGIAIMGFMLDMLNRAMSDDDEETGRNRYDLIPEFEKSKNWIFMNPMRPGEYVKVPLPLGPHVFHNAGRLISDAVFRKDPRNASEYGWSMASTLLDAFSPLGAASSVGQLIAPSILDPVVQIAENKSFTGGPVYKSKDRGFGHIDPKPAYTRFFENTPDLWKAASKGLNDISGGDKVKPGLVNIEPDILKSVFYTMTGGPGRTLDQALDATQSQARGDTPTVNRIPFASRFYGTNDDRQRERAYYDDRKRVADAKTQFDYFVKSGRPDLAREVAADLGEGNPAKGRKMMLEFKTAGKTVGALNKQIRSELEQQEKGGDRSEQIKTLKARRVKVMGNAVRDESTNEE